MKNLHYKITTLAFVLSTSASALAAQDENVETVTVDTPDSVLLEDVDFSEMAKVKKPSTRLTITVDGMPYEIEINNENDETVLVLPKMSRQNAELIKATYEEAAQIKNVDIQYVSGDEN